MSYRLIPDIKELKLKRYLNLSTLYINTTKYILEELIIQIISE
jgi:hypothetical protein